MTRGRLSSWALGAAFVAVVGLAAVDAVRQRNGGEEPPTRTLLGRVGVQERLREDDVTGSLLVTAPSGCRTTVWSLPDLTSDGDRPCAPPEPDVVRGAPVLPGELERAARLHLNAPFDSRRLRVLVDGVARLRARRVAVLLSLRIAGRPDLGGNQVIAFFERGRLAGQVSFSRGDLRELTASPSRRYVAALPGFVLRANGSSVDLPRGLVQAHALAWSPDGRWLALAQRANVALVSLPSLEQHDRTGSRLRTIDLPLEAREVEWR